MLSRARSVNLKVTQKSGRALNSRLSQDLKGLKSENAQGTQSLGETAFVLTHIVGVWLAGSFHVVDNWLVLFH